MSRRLAVTGVVGALVLLALVPVGRWERAARADAANEGMRRVMTAIGPLDSPALNAFRVLPDFDCLIYRRPGDRFALEFCADRSGRVVETIDRRPGDPEISSLRDEPALSSVRVDPRDVRRLVASLGAFR